MRRRIGAAILLVAILVGAVVMVETIPRDPAAETTAFKLDMRSSVEENVARYLNTSRELLLNRLGAVTAVRCAQLPTYGRASAGCDIVFEKAGRQRWYVMYTTGTDFVAKPCPARLQTAPGAEPEGPCNVVVRA